MKAILLVRVSTNKQDFAETDESPLDIRTVIGQMAEAKDVAVSLLCDRISENTRKIFFQR